jgi:hypothetical protein
MKLNVLTGLPVNTPEGLTNGLLKKSAHRPLISFLRPLRTALATGYHHSQRGARRHLCGVGRIDRLDGAAAFASARFRTRFVFSPIRRDACGRDGVGHTISAILGRALL